MIDGRKALHHGVGGIWLFTAAIATVMIGLLGHKNMKNGYMNSAKELLTRTYGICIMRKSIGRYGVIIAEDSRIAQIEYVSLTGGKTMPRAARSTGGAKQKKRSSAIDGELWGKVKGQLELAPDGLSAATIAARINESVEVVKQVLSKAYKKKWVLNEGLGAAAIFCLPPAGDARPKLHSRGTPRTVYSDFYGGPRR